MKNIFYLHPAKCAGTSVQASLKQLNVPHFLTENLELTQKTITELRTNNLEDKIITGHIGKLPKPSTKNEALIRNEILNILFEEFNLIVPTRNPANLVQSWMHYSKTRANQILMRIKNIDDLKNLSSKDCGMIERIVPLKQNIISINSIKKLVYQPNKEINLSLNDEEENLLNFINLLKDNLRTQYPILMSLGYQLFYPKISKIKKLLLTQKTFKLLPPQTNETRFVHYYNCENVSNCTSSILEDLIHPLFIKMLKNTRKNVSKGKPNIKGEYFPSVIKQLREITPNEFTIFNQSK